MKYWNFICVIEVIKFKYSVFCNWWDNYEKYGNFFVIYRENWL